MVDFIARPQRYIVVEGFIDQCGKHRPISGIHACFCIGRVQSVQEIVRLTVPVRRFRDAATKVSQKRYPSAPRLPITLLVRANKLGIGQYVTLHCSFDLRFRRAPKIERDVQGVEFMKITVPTDWRTRTAVSSLFEIIESKQGALR